MATKKTTTKKVKAKKTTTPKVADKTAAKTKAKKVASKKVIAKKAPKKTTKKTLKKVVKKAATAKKTAKKIEKKAVPAKKVAKKIAKKAAPTKQTPIKKVAKKVVEKAAKAKKTPSKTKSKTPSKVLVKTKDVKTKAPKVKTPIPKVTKEKPSKKKTSSSNGIPIPKKKLDPIIEEIKQRLLKERAEIIKILQTSKELERHAEELNFSNEIDLASSLESREMAFTLSSRDRNELKLIDEALFRIETDAYGMCVDCPMGNPSKFIGLKRLEIMPLTTLCVECQEFLEKS